MWEEMIMREFVDLINNVKQDKNMFYLVIDRMEPLINKYMCLLYKDEKEDARAELISALWEAVCNISFYNNDGQIVKFLSIALKNSYMELYKKSRKYHDNELNMENNQEMLQNIVCEKNTFDNVIYNMTIIKFVNRYSGLKKNIVFLILIEKLSDTEISRQLKVTRQYVNRVRKNLREKLKEEFVWSV